MGILSSGKTTNPRIEWKKISLKGKYPLILILTKRAIPRKIMQVDQKKTIKADFLLR
jgi:hypothetical protein